MDAKEHEANFISTLEKILRALDQCKVLLKYGLKEIGVYGHTTTYIGVSEVVGHLETAYLFTAQEFALAKAKFEIEEKK